MDKLKAFFTNKWTKIIAAVLLVISAVVLTVGGVSRETLNAIISGAIALVAAIAGIVTIISGLIDGGSNGN